jgi:transposase-like protein
VHGLNQLLDHLGWMLPGMSVSLVARQNCIRPGQLFTWGRLMAQGALTAAGAGEEVVPASEYRALQAQVSELQRLLGCSGRRCPGPISPAK